MSYLNLEDKEILVIRQSPYLGGGFYSNRIQSLNTKYFYDFLNVFSSTLHQFKPNHISVYRIGEEREKRKFFIVKRKESHIRERLDALNCGGINAICVKSKKYMFELTFFSTSVTSDYASIHEMTWGGPIDYNGPVLKKSPLEVFFEIYRADPYSMPDRFGFINLYPRECQMAALPSSKKATYDCYQRVVPLVERIATMRGDQYFTVTKGFLGFDEPAVPYDGRPHNLYWGNLIPRKLADSIKLEEFLKEKIGLEHVGALDTANPPQTACMGHVDNDYLFFTLSDDIHDSLNPPPAYADRYNAILDYYLAHDFIYPGY